MLFERGKQKILPTPLGEKIVAMAAKVLEQAAAIKDVAEADKDQLEGPISLGTLPTIGPYLLPQFIPLLQETTNKLSLYVEEGSVADLAGKLRNGDLDAILVTAPFAEADVVVQPLFDEPFVLLMPADHRLANKLKIEPSDLAPGELLLLGEGDSLARADPGGVPAPGSRSAETRRGGAHFHAGRDARNAAPHGGLEAGRDHPAADRGGGAAVCP